MCLLVPYLQFNQEIPTGVGTFLFLWIIELSQFVLNFGFHFQVLLNLSCSLDLLHEEEVEDKPSLAWLQAFNTNYFLHNGVNFPCTCLQMWRLMGPWSFSLNLLTSDTSLQRWLRLCQLSQWCVKTAR